MGTNNEDKAIGYRVGIDLDAPLRDAIDKAIMGRNDVMFASKVTNDLIDILEDEDHPLRVLIYKLAGREAILYSSSECFKRLLVRPSKPLHSVIPNGRFSLPVRGVLRAIMELTTIDVAYLNMYMQQSNETTLEDILNAYNSLPFQVKRLDQRSC